MKIKPVYVTTEQANFCMKHGFKSLPEQWQVIEWLEMNHQKYVYAFRYNGTWQYKIDAEHGCDYFSTGEGFKSKQEAYSEAFDYTFKELIN